MKFNVFRDRENAVGPAVHTDKCRHKDTGAPTTEWFSGFETYADAVRKAEELAKRSSHSARLNPGCCNPAAAPGQ